MQRGSGSGSPCSKALSVMSWFYYLLYCEQGWKKPGFKKKTQLSGFFWVFWVFWVFWGFLGFFAQMREFLGFFSVS
jgi:hypothetical protein